MTTQHRDPYAAAQQRAHEWLATVARQLGTDDRARANRALRAWLHMVRDRLSVDAAVHLGAQLPELLRGIYLAGWVPSQVPRHYGTTELRAAFAAAAGVPVADAAMTAAVVTMALRQRFSDGQLDHALAQLPRSLRVLLYYGEDGHLDDTDGDPAEVPMTRDGAPLDRVTRLEVQVARLTGAVQALVGGLEQRPFDEPTGTRAAAAAHEAHHILLAGDVT